MCVADDDTGIMMNPINIMHLLDPTAVEDELVEQISDCSSISSSSSRGRRRNKDDSGNNDDSGSSDDEADFFQTNIFQSQRRVN